MSVLFGRSDDPRCMAYFGTINEHYLELVDANNRMIRRLAALRKFETDQVHDDMAADIEGVRQRLYLTKRLRRSSERWDYD